MPYLYIHLTFSKHNNNYDDYVHLVSVLKSMQSYTVVMLYSIQSHALYILNVYCTLGYHCLLSFYVIHVCLYILALVEPY